MPRKILTKEEKIRLVASKQGHGAPHKRQFYALVDVKIHNPVDDSTTIKTYVVDGGASRQDAYNNAQDFVSRYGLKLLNVEVHLFQ